MSVCPEHAARVEEIRSIANRDEALPRDTLILLDALDSLEADLAEAKKDIAALQSYIETLKLQNTELRVVKAERDAEKALRAEAEEKLAAAKEGES